MIEIQKFVSIKKDLAARHGAFTLFALFLREDAPGKWDVLVAAPWAEADKPKTLKAVAAAITASLGPAELLALSRVIVLDHDQPVLHAIWSAMKIRDSIAQLSDCNLGGLQVKQAFILESDPTAATAVSDAP